MGMTLGSIADAASPISAAAQQPAQGGSIMGTPEPTAPSYGKGGAAANNQPLTPGASPQPTMGFGKFGGAPAQDTGGQQGAQNLYNAMAGVAFGTPAASFTPGPQPGGNAPSTGGFNYPTLPGYNDPSRTQNPLISKGVMPQRPMPQPMPGPGMTPPRGTPPQRVAPGRMPRQMPGRITF